MVYLTDMKQLCLIISLILFSGFATMAQQMTELRWLEGGWEQQSDAMTVRESWSFSATTGLKGASTIKKDNKVIFTEQLAIKDSLGSVFYIAQLPNKTAVFRADSTSLNYVRFIDPLNDFPHTLIYQRAGSHLEVTLLGIINEKPGREVLSFILVEQ
jgi:hypothetical protein